MNSNVIHWHFTYIIQLCFTCVYMIQLCFTCVYIIQLCFTCVYMIQLCFTCVYIIQLCFTCVSDFMVHLRRQKMGKVTSLHSFNSEHCFDRSRVLEIKAFTVVQGGCFSLLCMY